MPHKLQKDTSLFSTVRTVFHLVLAFFLLLGVVVLLIAVYHTLIYAATYLWLSLFTAVLPAITLILTLGVIFLKQPVQNLLCLISVFFSVVALYLYAGAEYLAFLFLIVYVGAVAILFLFVIMLLHIKKVPSLGSFKITAIFSPLAASVIVVCWGVNDYFSKAVEEFFITSTELLSRTETNTLSNTTWYITKQFSDILMFSDILYRANAPLFFIISFLLLTAMIGAIVLATQATDRAN